MERFLKACNNADLLDELAPLAGPCLARINQLIDADDLRSLDFEVVSPNIAFAEAMGLPNGSSYDPARTQGNGAVAAAPVKA